MGRARSHVWCVAMQGYLALFGVLIALLFGLAAGKAWERYKLVEGRWIDRRRVRRSPFFILGLNHLVAGQVDLAIEALEKASGLDPGAFELRLVLGNLYREKGQVGRAIGEHQSLLQRPRLNRIEQANVLLCLGLDYRRGGFVDRAVSTFTEVLKLDSENETALVNLEKLQEDQHQWQEAYITRQRLAHLAGPPDHPNSQSILAFLENELGMQAMKLHDLAEATRRFEAAIEAHPTVIPAYLHLGDVREQEGDLAGAAAIWEKAIEVAPDRAYLALDRLERVYTGMGVPRRFAELCRKQAAATPRDWRARMALARHLSSAGQPARALDLLFEALEHNPHALAIHQAIWNTLSVLGLPGPLVARYIDLTRESVFYLDPHVCVRCRYRSTEVLWQCPHCHEWNTFVEERITPASDTEAEIPAGLVQ
jgi:lipopolysaccharide assembly protein B